MESEMLEMVELPNRSIRDNGVEKRMLGLNELEPMQLVGF